MPDNQETYFCIRADCFDNRYKLNKHLEKTLSYTSSDSCSFRSLYDVKGDFNDFVNEVTLFCNKENIPLPDMRVLSDPEATRYLFGLSPYQFGDIDPV